MLEAEAEAEEQALKGEAEAYAIEVKAKVSSVCTHTYAYAYAYAIEVKAKVGSFWVFTKGYFWLLNSRQRQNVFSWAVQRLIFGLSRLRQSRWRKRQMLGRSTRRPPWLI